MIMLKVIMLSAIMLSVVAPGQVLPSSEWWSLHQSTDNDFMIDNEKKKNRPKRILFEKKIKIFFER
jgi:hypothetical protein